MRVGLLIDTLVGGGAERMVLNFSEKFIDLGHDARVIVLRDKIEHSIEGARLHILSGEQPISSWRTLDKFFLAKRLKKCVRDIESDGTRFDFFISNSEDMDRISAMAMLPWVFIRYRNSMCEYIASKVGNKLGIKRRIRHYRWMRKFRGIYSNRHLVAISEAMNYELVHSCGIRPATIATIYNPFGFSKIQRLANECDPSIPDGKYIIYVARFSNRKDQRTLVRAFVHLDLPHKLVLLGDATAPHELEYKSEIIALINKLGLQSRVLMPGFKENPYPWIKRASLFAMSSRSEGLPLVLVESLVIGTPVVSTDCPTGPSEVLVGELSKFLSAVGDEVALGQNIKLALRAYPPIQPRMLSKFDDEVAIKRYIDHYHSLSSLKDK